MSPEERETIPLWRPPWWVRDLFWATLVVTLGLAPFPGTEVRTTSILATAVVIAPVFLLPFRHRWPAVILALCIALYGVAAFTGTLAPGVILAAALAMFVLALRSTRRTTLIAAGIAVLAVLALSLFAAVSGVLDPRVVQFAVIIAFASAAGDATRSRRAYIVAVTERAERAEQTRESEALRRVSEERLRIARDLHDAVAHQISVISLNAGVASSSLETRPDAARDALAAIRTASRNVLGEIGDLLAVLRQSENASAAVAPQPGLTQLDELVGQFLSAGLDVTVRVEGDRARVPVAADIVAYRVVQEGLTNASKHGSPRRAHLLVSVDEDAVRIVITNPVAALTEAPTGLPGGNGLVGMQERVASVRGTVEGAPTAGGYRLSAMIPLARETPAEPAE